MTREEACEYTKDVYQDFRRAVSLNEDYVFQPISNDESTLNKFVDYLDGSYGLSNIGIEFLVNWIESGFNYWFDIPTQFGTGVIMFNWVFGAKAIERYEKIKVKDRKLNRYTRKIREEVGIRVLGRYRKIDIIDLDGFLLGVKKEEEEAKKLYYNTEEGLLWCRANTTLYNHSSELCLFCNNKGNCKRLLSEQMPKLYTKRGYR